MLLFFCPASAVSLRVRYFLAFFFCLRQSKATVHFVATVDCTIAIFQLTRRVLHTFFVYVYMCLTDQPAGQHTLFLFTIEHVSFFFFQFFRIFSLLFAFPYLKLSNYFVIGIFSVASINHSRVILIFIMLKKLFPFLFLWIMKAFIITSRILIEAAKTDSQKEYFILWCV